MADSVLSILCNVIMDNLGFQNSLGQTYKIYPHPNKRVNKNNQSNVVIHCYYMVT